MPNDVGFQPGPGASGYQAVGNPAYQSRTGAAAGGGTAAGGAFVPYSASKSLRPPMPVARAAQKPAGAPIKPALIKPALGTPAAWMTDPTSRHQLRYFDGASWTENVANDGIASVDPLD
jgi:hypothetical protein